MAKTYEVIPDPTTTDDEEKKIRVTEVKPYIRLLTVQEIKQEITELELEINELQSRRESLLDELQRINDANIGITITDIPKKILTSITK